MAGPVTCTLPCVGLSPVDSAPCVSVLRLRDDGSVRCVPWSLFGAAGPWLGTVLPPPYVAH